MELNNLTIRKFHEGLKNKEFSVSEIIHAYLGEIEKKNGELNAYLSLSKEDAHNRAEAVDEAVKRGDPISYLAGAPLAIKDNILIESRPATASSKILEKYVSAYDATVIKKLKSERAIFLGKTNLDEFAMGSSTENSAFGPTRNPRDPSRVPGGSSGGSAAAVAANLALAALGSDTGGSIRQPAAFCGVVGLKPTYGAVSRYGLIAMASSLDQIGPITKTVEDAAILFRAIHGKDSHDATGADYEYRDDFLNIDRDAVKRMIVGVPDEYFGDGISDNIKNAVQGVIAELGKSGIQFKRISLPHTKYALSVYYIVMPAEISSNLARFEGIRYGHREEFDGTLLDLYRNNKSRGFGLEAKRRIALGTFVLSSGYYDAYYAKAQKVRTLIRQDFLKAFDQSTGSGVDVILAPVTPTTAFKIGEKASDPLAMYMSDILTIPANLAGLPAISIPCANRANEDRIVSNGHRIFDNNSTSLEKNSRDLPVGFQLIGNYFREDDLFDLGQFYEGLVS
jgi:aspartyl-tRNA(Asn)/glutamyl-tRNA(Gln) amidotransferase subunit A